MPELRGFGSGGVSRRGLFKKTLGGAALLAAAGAVPLAMRKTQLREVPAGRTLLFFTPAEYSIMAAVAERVLAQTVPDALASAPPGGEPTLPPALGADMATLPQAPTPSQLDVAGRLDLFLAPSDPAVAKDFKQLLALFDNALFSLVSGGPPTPFTKMSPEQQDRQLGRWAQSRLPMLRSGYQALKRLSAALYFCAPETFASMGYPGPPYELVRTVNEARDAAKRAAQPVTGNANSATNTTPPAESGPVATSPDGGTR